MDFHPYLLDDVEVDNTPTTPSTSPSRNQFIRKVQRGIHSYLLGDVEVDDTLGSLKSPEWKNLVQDSSGSTQCWPVYGPFQSLLHWPTIHDGRQCKHCKVPVGFLWC